MIRITDDNEQDDDTVLDFYIGGREFLDGIGDPARQKIKNFSEELSLEFNSASLSCPESYRLQEKNYGYGADWIIVLVEFIANNDWIGAAAKVGGLISLGKHVRDFIKKRSDQNVYLGIRASRLVAVNAINEMVEIRDVELLSEVELDRGESGFAEKEYLFVLGVNKQVPTSLDVYNKDNIYRGIVFVALISWKGEVKSINKF